MVGGRWDKKGGGCWHIQMNGRRVRVRLWAMVGGGKGGWEWCRADLGRMGSFRSRARVGGSDAGSDVGIGVP